MSTAFRIAVVCGLAIGVASCSTARNLWPFGRDDTPSATASAGERIPILEFEQQLTPAPNLAGRQFLLPAPQAVSSHALPGGNSEQVGVNAIAGEAFAIAWKRSIGEGSSRTSQVMAPLVADGGRIFTLDGEATVSAVDAATGQIVWRANMRPSGKERGGFGGGLAVAGGKVFVVSGYRFAAALDQATGNVLWNQPMASPLHGAPTVAGNRVYAVDVDNQLTAFDAATGEPTWTYQGITEPARVLRASSPAVSGETVVAPFSSGEVVALRATNGQEVWQQALSRTSRTSALTEIRDIAGRPAINRGFVYAVSHSGVLGSLDLRTGQPRWTLPIAGVNAPLVIGDVVYVVSNTGVLTTIHQDSGQVYWSRELNEGRQRKTGGFFGIGSRIERPQWSGPIMANNRLILVSSWGDALALDARTGDQVAALRLGDAAYISPIAYDGALYVLTDKGQLISIR